ncbi:hypothetical protein HYPSUDRAFT_58596 [Hypholoma sublateritium FD-334 SS-4]|uniref:Uncharacterized protein n=1 Tax=Hypholoma sublateritium (strain FD-334 SS-4) TaxID=945553 RepID=A0A0D2KMI8_HYPSF|nr:hypothetical protein HYPSUDRAFT_58596 [Hypholoma sublateritium FD-334 SS-4]
MVSSSTSHPWPVPDVSIPDPLGANHLPITPLPSLKFHPIGLLHLRRHLGLHAHLPGFFQQHQKSFQASDLAWFAAGLHRDGQHFQVAHDQFHPEYMDLHRVCGNDRTKRMHQKQLLQDVQDLMFDLATLLDRAGGGTTLILHAKPTIVPGSPRQPQYMKAEVYFPPAFIAQHPNVRPALLRIAQDFIVNIGVETVEDWNNRARNCLGWNFVSTHPVPPANAPMLDVPAPELGTARYLFRGQPVISTLAAAPPAPALPSAPPPAPAPPPPTPAIFATQQSQASTDYFFEEYDGEVMAGLAYQEYQEHISTLSSEVNSLTHQVEILASQVSALELERQEARSRISMLERMLQFESLPAAPSATPPSNRSLGKSPRKPVPRTPATPPVSQTGSPFVHLDTPTSPFVTLRSERQHPSSRFHTPEPNSPSGSSRRTAQSAKVTSPPPQAATRAVSDINSPGPLSMSAFVLEHILKSHGISNLKEQVILILKYVSVKSDKFSVELASAGVPKDVVLEIVNPKNAFVAMQAPEKQSMHLLKFWNTCKEEYESLDEQEREAMIQEFKQSQQATTNILRPCPRARIQEVSDTVRNIELLSVCLAADHEFYGFIIAVVVGWTAGKSRALIVGGSNQDNLRRNLPLKPPASKCIDSFMHGTKIYDESLTDDSQDMWAFRRRYGCQLYHSRHKQIAIAGATQASSPATYNGWNLEVRVRGGVERYTRCAAEPFFAVTYRLEAWGELEIFLGAYYREALAYIDLDLFSEERHLPPGDRDRRYA